MTTHVDRTVEKLVGWEPTHVVRVNGEFMECKVKKRATSRFNYNINIYMVENCKQDQFWVDDKTEFYAIDHFFQGLS